MRSAGLLGSMGGIGDAFDNAVAESCFGNLQLELLDEHRWDSRARLGSAIFDWIEAWYQPPPTAQLLRAAQPRRLRSHPPRAAGLEAVA